MSIFDVLCFSILKKAKIQRKPVKIYMRCITRMSPNVSEMVCKISGDLSVQDASWLGLTS